MARATRLDQKTGMGKAFVAIAERIGIDGAQLTRIDELPETFRLLSDDALHVVVRSELLVSMSPGEILALFALALEQGRPVCACLRRAVWKIGSGCARRFWPRRGSGLGMTAIRSMPRSRPRWVPRTAGAARRRLGQRCRGLDRSPQRGRARDRAPGVVPGQRRAAHGGPPAHPYRRRTAQATERRQAGGSPEYFSSTPALRGRVAFVLSPICAAQFE